MRPARRSRLRLDEVLAMMIVVIGAVVVAAKERHHSQVLTPPLVPYGILDVERGRSPARISCRGVEDTVSCP